MDLTTRRNEIRRLIRSYYDAQKLRISVGNRIVTNIYTRLGRDAGMKKEQMEKESQHLLNQMLLEYRRLADAIAAERTYQLKVKALEKQAGVISNYLEFELAALYSRLLEDEANLEKAVEYAVKDHPVYTGFLSKVKGIGPLMAGVLLAEFDPYRAEYPSSLWKYAGYDVAPDGKGRSRREEHLVLKKYIDRNGEEKERLSITFNPWLKTKLYVLGECLLRAGDRYKEVYDGYRHRLDHHPAHKDKTKMHKHRMAMRYMIKIFLIDFYVALRTAAGLPVSKPYHEEKLGIVHGKAAAM